MFYGSLFVTGYLAGMNSTFGFIHYAHTQPAGLRVLATPPRISLFLSLSLFLFSARPYLVDGDHFFVGKDVGARVGEYLVAHNERRRHDGPQREVRAVLGWERTGKEEGAEKEKERKMDEVLGMARMMCCEWYSV